MTTEIATLVEDPNNDDTVFAVTVEDEMTTDGPSTIAHADVVHIGAFMWFGCKRVKDGDNPNMIAFRLIE